VRQLGEREVRGPAASSPARVAPEIPRLDVSAPGRSRAKRALDLVVVVVTLPLVLVIGLVAAGMVRLTSRGPVVFGQERVGLGGERFIMYKFRTMHRGAEELLRSDPSLWAEYVANGYKVPAGLDRRVTRVGRFLRSSSLDELPQLVNVVLGDMSLVGPRPVVPDEVENYGEDRTTYLSVRPGLTGAWQVNGRSTIDYPQRVALDIEYVRSWSLWRDVKILAKTPFAVLGARGAH
jgi:lipopolysaccharide/colanic/teichoic acid biosynthesis glycosyltransferase